MWSVYLLTIRWANRPGPGSPLAIGIAGLGTAITTVLGSRSWHGDVGGSGRGLWAMGSGGGEPCSGLVSGGADAGGETTAGGAGWGSASGAGKGSVSWLG